MKLEIILLMVMADLNAGLARAQETKSENAVPIPNSKLPIPLDKLPLNLQLRLDPKLPVLPELNANQKAGTTIRVLETYHGPVFQAEVKMLREMAEKAEQRQKEREELIGLSLGVGARASRPLETRSV